MQKSKWVNIVVHFFSPPDFRNLLSFLNFSLKYIHDGFGNQNKQFTTYGFQMKLVLSITVLKNLYFGNTLFNVFGVFDG